MNDLGAFVRDNPVALPGAAAGPLLGLTPVTVGAGL